MSPRANRFSRLIAQCRGALNRPVQSVTRNLTCEQVTDLTADHLAVTLDPQTTSAFEEHLRGCLDCVAFLSTYKRAIHMVRSLRDREIPAEVEERVRYFLETQTKRGGGDSQPPSRSSPSIIGRLCLVLRGLPRDPEHKEMSPFPLVSASISRLLHLFPSCRVKGVWRR